MKKKGFTLVELLAVIAILAILVIVAMPNVLGMFNQAKANTFVTEVQKYMDTAKTSFMTEAMSAGGSEIIFSSEVGSGKKYDGKAKALAMDGAEKSYVIWFDRNGKFERVVIYDDNFCYDSARVSGFSKDTFDKSTVKVGDVYERDTVAADGVDSLTTASDAAATVPADIVGCKGTAKAKTE